MPVRLHQCTPTSLNTWLDCPRRYRFSYIDRPPPIKRGPWAHNSLGASVHNALRDWWDLPLEERVPEAARRLITSKWIDLGWRDLEQQELWREQAIVWTTDYLATVDPHDEPIGIERGVALRTETLALSGRIDRLDERAEGLVVVDYKTGRWVPDDAEAR
jgi:RecB family exonuclease